MNRRPSAGIIVLAGLLAGYLTSGFAQQEKKPNPFSPEIVGQAQKLYGLDFNEAKRDSVLENLADQFENYLKIRAIALPNSVPPAILFNPIPVGFQFEKLKQPFRKSQAVKIAVPKNPEDLAFASVGQLAALIRTRKITSLQLTTMYLDRLKKYGPKLECVITLTDELALKQAKRADDENSERKVPGTASRNSLWCERSSFGQRLQDNVGIGAVQRTGVHKKNPEVGRTTVYRTLKLLQEAGLASSLEVQGQSRFEHEFGREHHDHFICKACGTIFELSSPEIERLQDEIADGIGFRIEGHRHQIFGFCRRCEARREDGELRRR